MNKTLGTSKSSGPRRRGRDRPRSSRRGKEAPRPKGALREWFEAIIFAVVVVVIVRTFFFDLFRIPTPSMENSLLVGDYLFVSKVHYGPRTPMTLGVPFTSIYIPGLEFPYYRLPGFSSIERDDNIVFNWPEPDGPVDRKMHYIKRVVGMPGDELGIEDKVVVVNGEPLEFREAMQHFWRVSMANDSARLPQSRLRALGVSDVRQIGEDNEVAVTATRSAADEIASWPYVDDIEPYVHAPLPEWQQRLFPEGSTFTPDNYGPIVIPEEGMTIELDEESLPLYAETISRFEEQSINVRDDGTVEINGEPASEYTFEQDYFFVLGDNRDNSEDSRFWGFVPEDHIVGKAMFVYFSWDAEASFPRFERIFHRIR